MSRLDGKVALVTGAARGQGRAHAVRLAREGATIVAVDRCADVDTVPYGLAGAGDLGTTAELVEEHDRQILTAEVDVRDLDGLRSVVAEATDRFGGIDIVVANAGIMSFGASWELTETQWRDVVDTNLTGVWKTTTAVIPGMIERGRGGSIIITSSVAGLVAYANLSHYTAAKHGVTGLMRALAVELARFDIRVNSVHPTVVNTDMVHNRATYGMFLPGVDDPTDDDVRRAFAALNGLGVPWVEPEDVSEAVLYLASESGRRVTGSTMSVDAGAVAPYKIPHG